MSRFGGTYFVNELDFSKMRSSEYRKTQPPPYVIQYKLAR
jgi:hypothetical protein